ncbi:hypothetical protein [Palleronia caenipelagi]|uniref:Uncharacterized protein n=1 Tax=Palleronia caenipelagi TaxID=2489174 RepID=A0A547Q6B4_9RHOB|nr:hypothetical protein [Palleronia caenipelagi]TRD21894.1 hypothetical protein FEV53_07545 [Palleronia caenipelagi]
MKRQKTAQEILAERVLVAVCGHLCLETIRNENFVMWLGVLEKVAPHCARSDAALAPLRCAANNLLRARPGKARDTALCQLRFQVAHYFAAMAAKRLEEWTGGGRS